MLLLLFVGSFNIVIAFVSDLTRRTFRWYHIFAATMIQNLNKIVHVLVGSVHAKHEWSYEGECGPQTWSKTFVGARGKNQSPINIETSLTKYDPNLLMRPLVIDYDHHTCSQIKNTGHTFQVDAHKTNLSSKLIFIYRKTSNWNSIATVKDWFSNSTI